MALCCGGRGENGACARKAGELRWGWRAVVVGVGKGWAMGAVGVMMNSSLSPAVCGAVVLVEVDNGCACCETRCVRVRARERERERERGRARAGHPRRCRRG